MFTPIDKNLLIAAMESAIFQVYQRANITSLGTIETRVSALRQKFDATPEQVSDDDVFALIDTIQKAQIPDFTRIDSIPRPDVAYSYIWERILNKPTAYPTTWGLVADKPGLAATAHQHTTSEIADFPATMPPTTHQHTKAEISDFPTTMTPTAHQHTKAEISDFPTTMTPTAHQHVTGDISNFPTTMTPTAHTHTKAQISDFPTTMTPSAHSHIVVVSYTGNGVEGRVISITGYTSGQGQLLVARLQSTNSAIYMSVSGNQVVYHGGSLSAGAFGDTTGGIVMNAAVNAHWNVNGVTYQLMYIK